VKKHTHAYQLRRGFTLSEMLVVLGLLVAVTALSQPVLSGALQDSRLRSAGKMVRTELAKARLKAMKTGVAQRFRHELGKCQFETAPVALGDPRDQTLTSMSEKDGALPEGEKPAPGEETARFSLPTGVSFDDREEEGGSETMSSEDGWSDPIVFYPNGHTDSAHLRLKGDRNSFVEIALRGLTGAATAGRLHHEEELR